MTDFRKSLRVSNQQGFTLIELIVALAVSTTLVILILQMLDLNSRVGRVQIDLAEVQQSQRVVHNVLGDSVRLAGRGGIPVALALNVLDNIDSTVFTVDGNDVVDSTDVLQVRGVFENIILVDDQDRDGDGNPEGYSYNPATQEGTITIKEVLPTFPGRTQDLSYFQEAIDAGRPVALVMVSARNVDTIAVVQLQPGSAYGVDIDGIPTATLNFSSDEAVGLYNDDYLALSTDAADPGPDWPGDDRMSNISMVGILDEHWYYVREPDSAVEGDHPRLSRAQLFPNTTVVVGNASNGRVDVADNVIDLQLERAFDLDGDMILDEDFENQDADEWLGNHPSDDFANPQWADLTILSHVAINTITRSQRTHQSFISEPIDNFLNHDYSEPANPASQAEIIERRHRRRIQRTVVEMRNL